MRTLLKVVLFLGGTVLLVLLAGFCWLYFYSRDLPDITSLTRYSPGTVTEITDSCLGSSIAVPYDALGANLRNAISAVETSEADPGVLSTTSRGLLTEEPRQRTTIASWYISRTMCRAPSRELRRQFAELRTAIQLERHYSRRHLFTMYANRVYLGPGLIGVQQGSAFYFRKQPAELTPSEAALLAGLIRGPSWLSPAKHPDRALRRRNEVLDAMVGSGSIPVAEAEAAKAAPLGVVSSVAPETH